MKKLKTAASLLFVCSLLAAGIADICTPQKTFSEQENRTLTKFPEMSLSGISDGSFQSQITQALSDQFPERDKLMSQGTQIKLLMGRQDISNTYIGKDHYYFEKVLDSNIDEKRFENNLEQIQQTAKMFENIPVNVMLVPSSGIIMSDKLPDYAQMYNADKLYKKANEILTDCKVINPTKELKEAAKTQQVYYRTDHHWTADGAYAGYQAFTKGKGAYGKNNTKKVTDSFLGTLYSRTLDKNAVSDSIECPDVSPKVRVTENGKKAKMYDLSKLRKKDKYQVFLGGNCGLTEISGSGKKTVLVIKDSFANSFVPYLTADYRKIIMIDLRYYPFSVKQLVKDNNIDEILVLYQMNNFASDSNIVKLAL